MKMTSRSLAVLLALCMVLSLGAGAFASGEPAAAAPAASGEPAGQTDTAEVQAAYVEYIHQFLLAELAVNSAMTSEQVENEFMPGVQAAMASGDWSQFPVDMLFNGMLNSGVAMTYEEFAAQYVPAGDASGEASVEDAYVEYVREWLLAEQTVNSALTAEQIENEFIPGVQAALVSGDWSQFPVDMLFNGMLNSGVAMTFEQFAAEYVPAAATAAASGEPAAAAPAAGDASGEPAAAAPAADASGEPAAAAPAADASGEPAAAAPAADASGEASDDASGEMSVEDAYVEYIHEFLLAELAVNGNMTTEQVEDEFMPAVKSAVVTGDWVNSTTPAPLDILFNGMLVNGAAKTFEEFAAEYVPASAASGEPAAAAPAAGDTSEAAYKAYLKAYVDAVPAVSDAQYAEFAAAIDAGAYDTFPVDMCFQDTFWGHVAMTYAEFVAAGGVYTIPAFDPGLTAD